MDDCALLEFSWEVPVGQHGVQNWNCEGLALGSNTRYKSNRDKLVCACVWSSLAAVHLLTGASCTFGDRLQTMSLNFLSLSLIPTLLLDTLASLFPFLISGLLCFLWPVQPQRSVLFQKHWFSFQWLPGLYTDKCYLTLQLSVERDNWKENCSCFHNLFHLQPCKPHSYPQLHPVLQFYGSLSQITKQIYRRVGSSHFQLTFCPL